MISLHPWILLSDNETLPVMRPLQPVNIVLQHGVMLRVMYRFVKNIKAPIAAYQITNQMKPDESGMQ